jgi:hypothetical protein
MGIRERERGMRRVGSYSEDMRGSFEGQCLVETWSWDENV